MGSEWKEYKLSELMEIIGGGTPKTNIEEYWNGKIPWISVKDFNSSYRRVFETEKMITEVGLANSSAKILNEGDIVISARGTIGAVTQLGRKMAFNQSCYGIKAKDKSTNDFLYYLLKNQIGNLKKSSHGSVFETITRETFDILTARIPEAINEQTKIARILVSLDNKIEINNKINKILEEIAQAIFKRWFIDFEFPNENGEPYKSSGGEMINSSLGPIPKGWELKRIEEVAKCVGGGTPSTKNSLFWENGNINWVTPKDLSKIKSPILLETDRKITKAGLERISSGLLPQGTVLMSSRAPIGYTVISTIPVSVNQGFIAMICNENISNYYIYHWVKSNIQLIKSKANGTSFLEISKRNFKPIEIVVPGYDILRTFDKFIDPIFKMIQSNEVEIKRLSKLRDILLPKLMSGEIRINTNK